MRLLLLLLCFFVKPLSPSRRVQMLIDQHAGGRSARGKELWSSTQRAVAKMNRKVEDLDASENLVSEALSHLMHIDAHELDKALILQNKRVRRCMLLVLRLSTVAPLPCKHLGVFL